MVWPLDEAASMIDYLTTAAEVDPLSGVLVAIGGIVIGVAVALVTVLGLGAVVDAVRRIGA